jgi:two-component system, sensor histidine kinase and response regulator
MSTRVCWIIVVLQLVASRGLSQSQKIDSLIRVALATPFDSTRVSMLNDVAYALREADSNLALKYATEAKDLAIQLEFKKGLGYSLENIGWIYYRQGKYSDALQTSTEALRINQQLNDKNAISNCLNNIGAIHFEQKLYPIALKSFKEAYSLAKQAGAAITMLRSLNNISFAFLKLRQLDSARYYTLRSINEPVNDKARTAFSFRMLGDISFEEGDYKDAIKNYEACMRTAEQQSNNFLKTSTLFRLGKVYLKLNMPNQALVYLNQNIPIAVKYRYKSELESTYKLLYELHAGRKDFVSAFDFQTKYHALHDSLIEQKSGEQIALIQTRYDSEIKNAQIDQLTKNSKTQRIWIYIAVGWLFLLIIFAAILIRSNRRGRKINKLLAEKNNLINEQTEQLIGLNSTKDKLFSIIGHDMRSPLASLRGLVDLVGSAAMTQEEFVEMSKKLKKNLDHVHADLENLLSWAQTQQHGLTPVFENVLLCDAVEDKIELYREAIKTKSIQIVNSVSKDACVHADKNHVGLVIRNLIGNAIKFSHPKGSIMIDCSEVGSKIKISVSDTGIGISPDELNKLFKPGSHFSKPGTQNEKGIGLGLLLVKEFVELNKGTIEVASDVGEGSTFTFYLSKTA